MKSYDTMSKNYFELESVQVEDVEKSTSWKKKSQTVSVLLAILLVGSLVAVWTSSSSPESQLTSSSSSSSPRSATALKLEGKVQSESHSQWQSNLKVQGNMIEKKLKAHENNNEVASKVDEQQATHFRARTPVDGVVPIYQSDFTQGTVRFTQAGSFKLMEDIVFGPNPNGGEKTGPGAFLPDYSQASQVAEYPRDHYVLGFFSAITIEAPNVILDLGGHTIKQSRAFFLMQRVYAHITLANSPFIQNTGPNDFGVLVGALNCVVKNGKLGMSSHHGIHGNEANGCKIMDMTISDFELAGIAQNNVHSLFVKNVKIGPPLAPVVRGQFVQARMLLEFFRNHISEDGKEKKIQFANREEETAKDLFERVSVGLDLVFDWFVNGNEFARNADGYDDEFESDGQQEGSSIYGIVINGIGPAVTGIGFSRVGSEGVILEKIEIFGMNTKTREVVSVAELSSGEPQVSIGPTGEQVDVFRWSDFVEGSEQEIGDLNYIGNLHADALFGLNEYCLHLSNLSATPFFISDMLRNWAMDGKEIANPYYVCNGDAQFHVIKGVFGIRIEGTNNFALTDVEVDDIESRGDFGSELCNPESAPSHPESGQTLGYGGTAAYGISITKSNGTILRTKVSNVRSERGVSAGIAVWDESRVEFVGDNEDDQTMVRNIEALGGGLPSSMLGSQPPAPSNGDVPPRLPNRFPESCGLDVRSSTVTILGMDIALDSRCLTSPLVCAKTQSNFGTSEQQCGSGSGSPAGSGSGSGPTLLRQRLFASERNLKK